MNPGRAFAHARYLDLDVRGRLEGAGPHGMIALCYDELQQALAVARSAAKVSVSIVLHPQVARARSILIGLESSLDFSTGGDLAVMLATTYRAMRRDLAVAAQAADGDRLEAIREGVRSLADSWRLIAPMASAIETEA